MTAQEVLSFGLIHVLCCICFIQALEMSPALNNQQTHADPHDGGREQEYGHGEGQGTGQVNLSLLTGPDVLLFGWSLRTTTKTCTGSSILMMQTTRESNFGSSLLMPSDEAKVPNHDSNPKWECLRPGGQEGKESRVDPGSVSCCTWIC